MYKSVDGRVEFRKGDSCLSIDERFPTGMEQGISVNYVSIGAYIVAMKLLEAHSCHLYPPSFADLLYFYSLYHGLSKIILLSGLMVLLSKFSPSEPNQIKINGIAITKLGVKSVRKAMACNAIHVYLEHIIQ